MDQAQIKHLNKQFYRKLKKATDDIANFDADKIHQFRVSYKKWRAFFRLIVLYEDGAKEIKISKKLKKAYHLSGTIRDLQLQVQRMKTDGENNQVQPTGYIDLLKEEEKNLKPELMALFDDGALTETKKKTDSLMPEDFPDKGFIDFIQRKWSVIVAMVISKHFSDDHIHSIRKNLKDVFYNFNLYKTTISADPPDIWKGKDAKYFELLLDELGKFQDKCTAIALIKSHWLIDLKDREVQLLNSIKKRWMNDKLKIKQSLVARLKVDFNSL